MTESETAQKMLDYALNYATKHKIRVIPIAPGSKRPPLDEWQVIATTDKSLVTHWWTKRFPGFGIGGATGEASGHFVLDVDISDGKRGDETLADLLAQYGELPLTPTVITGSGGTHYYFKWPGFNPGTGKDCLGIGLDIRAEGGQTIMPPSLHKSGNTYEWELSAHIDDVPIVDAPMWMLDLLRMKPTEPKTEQRREKGEYDDPGVDYSGSVTWAEILCADGATCVDNNRQQRDGGSYELWARPGVDDHWSATLGYGGAVDKTGSYILKVFTPNWGGVNTDGTGWSLEEGRTYDKFGYYIARNFGSPDDPANVRKATRRLLSQGFGKSYRQQDEDFKKKKVKPEDIPYPDEGDDVVSDKIPTLGEDAFIGLVGRVANSLDPFTEADKNAILVSFLTAFGVAVGNNAHTLVGITHVPPALYTVVFGESGIARKSTAINLGLTIVQRADPVRVVRGLPNSGESLIDILGVPDDHDALLDGPADQRLLITTDEFGAILEAGKRSGSTTPQVLRIAFDQVPLYTRSRGTGEHKAEGYHLGVLSAITTDELVEKLTSSDIKNGSANRFLYCFAGTEKIMSRGDSFPSGLIDRLVDETRKSLVDAKHINSGNGHLQGAMDLTPDALDIWDAYYTNWKKTHASEKGVLKDILARSDVIPSRIAVAYACQDEETNDNLIHAHHMQAALTVWRYVRESVQFIWRPDPESLSDGAMKLLSALGKMGTRGLTRSEQFREVFGGNSNAKKIGGFRNELINGKFAVEEEVESVGTHKRTLVLRITERGQKRNT